MTINGKVHCLFEQSGTFKKEFKKLGYPAEDYDIQNNFGETDHVIDLFAEIDSAYEGGVSVFDSMTKDDLLLAFYPCIYFCAMSQVAFYLSNKNYVNLTDSQKVEKILQRSNERHDFYNRLIRLVGVSFKKGLRVIIENPWAEQTYLKANFLKVPDFVDMDRTLRGDYFKKPTAYWFWNCEPTDGFTYQKDKEQRRIQWERKSSMAGVCSEDRSMMAADYARNFICDNILGIPQKNSQMSLFGEV